MPLELQRAMAAEAEASQEAKAKVIDAEGELKASKALRQAADVIASSPGAMQVFFCLLLPETFTGPNVIYHKLGKVHLNLRFIIPLNL